MIFLIPIQHSQRLRLLRNFRQHRTNSKPKELTSTNTSSRKWAKENEWVTSYHNLHAHHNASRFICSVLDLRPFHRHLGRENYRVVVVKIIKIIIVTISNKTASRVVRVVQQRSCLPSPPPPPPPPAPYLAPALARAKHPSLTFLPKINEDVEVFQFLIKILLLNGLI